NFAPFATFVGSTITLNPFVYQEYNTVAFSNLDGYHITTNFNLPYISPNFTLNINIKRLSEGYSLTDAYYIAGTPLTLFLNTTHSPAVGDNVLITINISINDLARVIIDYD